MTSFMMLLTDFDQYKCARDTGIDLATFDQYAPAGTRAVTLTDQKMTNYLRTGVLDLQALNHAMYRGVCEAAYGQNHGPFGVMQMQLGVLNWNTCRVSPLEAMVRLWTHESFAASGDLVNYFHWRQVPYAQEQTLSGLLTADTVEDEGHVESQAFAEEDLPQLLSAGIASSEDQADIAMVFHHTSHWVWAIEPYSVLLLVEDASYTNAVLAYTDLVNSFYSALRHLDLSIDVISPEQSVEGYKMVIVPSLPITPEAFDGVLSDYPGSVVLGPSTGSRTPDFAYPPGLIPSEGALRTRLSMRVNRVETMRTYANCAVSYDGTTYNVSAREEWISCTRGNSTSSVTVKYTSSHRPRKPAACSEDEFHYLAFNPPVDMLVSYLGDVAAGVGIEDLAGRTASKSNDLGAPLRLLRRGDLLWAIKYGPKAQSPPAIDGELIVGDNADVVPVAGVLFWKVR
ncbi:glycoside hydrolase family 42 protein [Dothistroma septosporum NZE10]|uniref:beta-galactosidase n=1 Tax=Dothistroma septosporum (strain NZE10 / CBS 128990) TaxID=675120 RepID=N1PVV9_DOTSN|nr:glycoside hydrolase family 42 protein [Dothistroma septosporum NZE10]